MDPAYERVTPRDIAQALMDLGCPTSLSFRRFFEHYQGPFSSAKTGFELLDLIDQDANIQTQTAIARTQFGWPRRYLVLTNLVGNGALVYDCESDAVFVVDFEGGDRELLAGSLPPAWKSFEAFLVDYFSAN